MTTATEEQKAKMSALRFVITVEGDLEDRGTMKAEAYQLDAEGNVLETVPVKTKNGENVLVSLFEAGGFLQTLSLSMGRTIALAGGDVATAVGIQKAARNLGFELTPLSAAK